MALVDDTFDLGEQLTEQRQSYLHLSVINQLPARYTLDQLRVGFFMLSYYGWTNAKSIAASAVTRVTQMMGPLAFIVETTSWFAIMDASMSPDLWGIKFVASNMECKTVKDAAMNAIENATEDVETLTVAAARKAIEQSGNTSPKEIGVNIWEIAWSLCKNRLSIEQITNIFDKIPAEPDVSLLDGLQDIQELPSQHFIKLDLEITKQYWKIKEYLRQFQELRLEIEEVGLAPPMPNIPFLRKGGYRYREGKESYEAECRTLC